MKPVVVEFDIDLAAPPDVVWALLIDWERQGDWMLELSDVVVTSPHREGIGVEADANVKIGGISTRDHIVVDVWEPMKHLGVVHQGWVKGRGDLVLSATATGTHLHWTEELVPPLGPLGAVGIRLFRPLLVRTFRRDLRVLRKLVEAASDGR